MGSIRLMCRSLPSHQEMLVGQQKHPGEEIALVWWKEHFSEQKSYMVLLIITMHVAEKETRATYAKLFLSAAAVSAGIFLAICTITGESLIAEQSWWRAVIKQLDLLYSGGFLGPHNLLTLLFSVKNDSYCYIHGKKQACTDAYEKITDLLPQPEEFIRWKRVIHNPILSAPQPSCFLLSKYVMWLIASWGASGSALPSGKGRDCPLCSVLCSLTLSIVCMSGCPNIWTT